MPLVFRHDAKIADSATAKALGQKGGLTKARRVRLIDSVGLKKIADDASFKLYRDAAEEFVSHNLGELAKSAGGTVGPAPSTMVASAGLQLAASRWAFDKGAEENDASLIKLGSLTPAWRVLLLVSIGSRSVSRSMSRASSGVGRMNIDGPIAAPIWSESVRAASSEAKNSDSSRTRVTTSTPRRFAPPLLAATERIATVLPSGRRMEKPVVVSPSSTTRRSSGEIRRSSRATPSAIFASGEVGDTMNAVGICPGPHRERSAASAHRG